MLSLTTGGPATAYNCKENRQIINDSTIIARKIAKRMAAIFILAYSVNVKISGYPLFY